MKVLETPTPKVAQTANVKKKEPQARVLPQATQHQVAAVVKAVEDDVPELPKQKEGSLWPWYIGAALLGALSILVIRLTRQNTEQKPPTPADDYEIIEETDEDDEDPR